MRLRCDNLTLRFSSAEIDESVFLSLTLDIDGFSSLALLGPSGCGKTTLLRLCGGALIPQFGQLLLADENDILVKTGYLAQESSLLPWLSVGSNLALAERLSGNGWTDPSLQPKRQNLANSFGLSSHLSQRPSELSGGMKQRAALVNALTSGSNLLLLDEPFSGSDSRARIAMYDALREFASGHVGSGIVFTTHDATDVIALADMVLGLGASAGDEPQFIDARGGWRSEEKSQLAHLMLGSAIL